jgi:hypothetical protein
MPVLISDLDTQLAFSISESKGVFAILLGSGLSRAAEIPTGWEITLDIIRRVGLAQGVEEQPDWADWYRRKTGEEPNYSTLVEELAPSPEERRSILHSYIEPTHEDREEGRKIPTAAHRAIADLVAGGYVRVIVTTNFDRLMENALRERGVEPTIVASVDALSGAEPISHSQCYILKLHGDYKDARILNTDAELTAYPPQYDALLDRIFDEYGLIVCGWSGEWDHALRSAFVRAPNRRYPVYWAARGALGAGAQEIADLRRARVVPIIDADHFFKKISERIETLAQTQRQDPLSVELLVNTTKRYLAKSEFRIQLDEIFAQETERLLGGLESQEFPPSGTWDQAAFQVRLRKYESLAEPIARMAGVLGRWGDGSELPIVLDILRAVVRQADSVGNGLNLFLNVRSYPAVLVFTAYGLGLTRAERWDTLHQLFFGTITRDNREALRTVDCLFLWRWKGGSNDVWNRVDGLEGHHTPLSDYLLELFSEWGKSFVGISPDFELMFERFELLGSLANLESREQAEIQAEIASRRGWASMPVGRAGWHSSSSEKLFSELASDPTKSAILQAGFAQGSADFLALFVTYFRRSRTH